jgi:hypothetical protein
MRALHEGEIHTLTSSYLLKEVQFVFVLYCWVLLCLLLCLIFVCLILLGLVLSSVVTYLLVSLSSVNMYPCLQRPRCVLSTNSN